MLLEERGDVEDLDVRVPHLALDLYARGLRSADARPDGQHRSDRRHRMQNREKSSQPAAGGLAQRSAQWGYRRMSTPEGAPPEDAARARAPYRQSRRGRD